MVYLVYHHHLILQPLIACQFVRKCDYPFNDMFFSLSKPNFRIPVNHYFRVCTQVSWMVHLNHLGHGC